MGICCHLQSAAGMTSAVAGAVVVDVVVVVVDVVVGGVAATGWTVLADRRDAFVLTAKPDSLIPAHLW